MSGYHEPVLVREVIDGLRISPGKRYIDATVGGGGHAIEIIRRDGVLLGIDADSEAIEFARANLKSQGSKLKKEEGKDWILKQGNFRNIEQIAKANGFERVDGMLFDLGVSSHQLDTSDRGFSYRFEGPLDLRLDQAQGMSAKEYVAAATKEELYETFGTFGEEERARTIADAIVRARSIRSIETTSDLVRIIRECVGDKKQGAAILSRIFQALRIVVNDELAVLNQGLAGAKELLVPGGKLAVISFHSLEDRTVKLFLRQSGWQMVTKKPVVADRVEQERNPRSRSAKLRIAQKV